VEQLRRSVGRGAEDVIAHIEERAADPDQTRRYFAVGFRDGKVRIVFPKDDDPYELRQHVLANAKGIELFDTDADAATLEWANLLLQGY
jgi:hypothetical protein